MKYLDEHPCWYRYDKQLTPAWEEIEGKYFIWAEPDDIVSEYVIRTFYANECRIRIVVLKDRIEYYSNDFADEEFKDLSMKEYMHVIRMFKIAYEIQPYIGDPTFLFGQDRFPIFKRNRKALKH